MASKSTRDRLNEAEDALHSLLIGGTASVYVDQSGERVEYVKSNISQLRAYILSLRSELGLPLTPGGSSFGGPLMVRF